MRPLPPVVLLVVLAACDSADREVAPTVVRTRTATPMQTGFSTADRFGMRREEQAPAAADVVAFDFDLPPGWRKLPTSSLRPVNLEAPGEVAVWVTSMGAGAGGLDANLTRWRAKVGLGPAEPGMADAMPRRPLLGGDALVFDETAADRSKRLVGLMLFAADRSVFVTMQGSPEAVASVQGDFDRFAASLADATPAPAGSSSPHGDTSGTMPGAMPGMGESGASGSSGLAWTAPAHWQAQPPRMFVDAAWDLGDGVRLWISTLSGDGGGLEANLVRWAGQYGRPAPSAAEIDALARIPVLGQSAAVVDLTSDGSTKGMLGACAMLGPRSVFVKMDGPSDAVRSRRAEFQTFCASLREGP